MSTTLYQTLVGEIRVRTGEGGNDGESPPEVFPQRVDPQRNTALTFIQPGVQVESHGGIFIALLAELHARRNRMDLALLLFF